MKQFFMLLGAVLAGANAIADVTLKCDVSTRCDGYLKNCINEPFAISVNVDAKGQTVSVAGRTIKGDFSNPAEVAFPFTKYTVRINRFEYSAILVSDIEVRHGFCTKVEPAW